MSGHEFSAAEERALQALSSSFSLLSVVTDKLPPSDVRHFVFVVANEALQEVSRCTDELVKQLIRRALDTPTSDADLDARSTRLADAAQGVRALLVERRALSTRTPPRQEVLNTIAALFQQIGFADFDAVVALARLPRGKYAIAAETVPVERAYIELVSHLYRDMMAFVANHTSPLLLLERMASHWHFDRLSWPRTNDQEREFFMERENAWSLTQRRTLTLGSTVVQGFCQTPAFGGIPSREQYLAKAMDRAQCGIFVVSDVAPGRTTLERLPDGRVFHVREWMGQMPVVADCLVAGLLIPYEDSTWLRARGVLIVKPGNGHVREELGNAVRRQGVDAMQVIDVEQIFAVLKSRGAKMRAPLPETTRKRAGTVLMELHGALIASGRSIAVSRGEGPFDVAGDSADVQRRRFDIDSVVKDWMEALHAQAGVPFKGDAILLDYRAPASGSDATTP
jgi:hypothetical protein